MICGRMRSRYETLLARHRGSVVYTSRSGEDGRDTSLGRMDVTLDSKHCRRREKCPQDVRRCEWIIVERWRKAELLVAEQDRTGSPPSQQHPQRCCACEAGGCDARAQRTSMRIQRQGRDTGITGGLPSGHIGVNRWAWEGFKVNDGSSVQYPVEGCFARERSRACVGIESQYCDCRSKTL